MYFYRNVPMDMHESKTIESVFRHSCTRNQVLSYHNLEQDLSVVTLTDFSKIAKICFFFYIKLWIVNRVEHITNFKHI